MKKRIGWIEGALMIVAAAGCMGSSVQAAETASVPVAVQRRAGDEPCLTDLYYWRHDGREILLGGEDRDRYCFYGLRIGTDKADVLNTLRPAFTLMYELKQIGHQYLLRDVVYPDYYLAVAFDDQDRVMLITYQKNQIYKLD